MDSFINNGKEKNGGDAWVYSLLIAIFIFRMIYSYFLGLVPDEAYYWDWSRNLSFGYFDHPPMIAWLIFFSRLLFGETILGVRFCILVCAFAASAVSYMMVKKYVTKPSSFLLWAVLSNCVILFGVGSLLATPDVPLVLFWSLSLFFGYKAVFDSSTSSWILLGITAGLGFLSKYTFVLFPVSLVIFLLISKPYRFWFARWQPYAAGCVALLFWMPNLVWNQQHGWAAILFQFFHGVNMHGSLKLDAFGEFIAGQLLVLSVLPFVLLSYTVVAVLKKRPLASRITYLSIFFLVPFGFFLIASLQKNMEANWPAASYISGLILISVAWENLDAKKNRNIRIFAVLSAAFSVVTTAIILWHIQKPFLPIPPPNDPAVQAHGWKNWARNIDDIRSRIDPDHVLTICTNRYQEASLLGFYLPDHPRTFALNIGARNNQYSLFRENKPTDSSKVIFIHSPDDPNLQSLVEKSFLSITLSGKITLHQGNGVNNSFGIFTGLLRRQL
jgi:4-amino-4-deoxy-L-arabinose transferase-like glycosyltransferase